MKSLTLLLFSLFLYVSSFSQNGVYLFGFMDNAPGTTFDISVVVYTTPPVTAQFTVNPDGNITNGNAYWVDLPSADWTHFEVIYPTCNDETNILTVLADSLPNMIDVFYQIDYCPGVNDIYGCTDPEALNYDPNATEDDGSCVYDNNEGCVEVNLEVFCIDTLSMAYDLTISDDPFCCENSWDQLCQQNYEAFGGEPLPECADEEEDILGCTDPNAINFNPNANIDDGSCNYTNPDSCEANFVEVVVMSVQWGGEMSWVLFHEGDTVATDGNYQDNSTYSYPLCLEDGCYTFEMYDSFGDGWNGGNFMIFVNGSGVANGTLQTGDFGFVNFGINDSGCDSTNVVFGCTDPNALNYDPNATVDDGTCQYDNDVENDLCADATELQPGTQLISNVGAVNNENVWGECWAFGSGEGEQTSIWYSFTTPDEPATIHIEASGDGSNTLTDTQFGLFEECGGEMIYCDGNAGQGLFSAFNFECGELEENTTYILMIDGYFGDSGTCFLTYEVETGCNEVSGCTDPAAVNYNPSATVDDGSCIFADSCVTNLVSFNLNTANWGYEISWNLLLDGEIVASGNGYESDSNYTQLLCLEDGCYTFEMFDTFGDGWNGASYYFTEVGTNLPLSSGTLATDEYGTASFGLNAECEEECGDLSFEFIPFGDPALGCVISTEANYTGDDQSGTLVWDFGAGTPPQTGFDWTSGYQYSANGSYEVCVTYTTENCTLTYCDIFIATDCGGEISGCTDPNAINYNPNATLNDGSCQYADSCLSNLVLLQLNTELWGEEVSWSLFNDGNEVANGDGYENTSTYEHWLCLEDGCYTLELYDSWGDGWNGGSFEMSLGDEILISGTLESGEFTYFDFGINAEGCEPEIYGCTDPNAINYNPDATIDNGSCEYEEDCTDVTFSFNSVTTIQGFFNIYSGNEYVSGGLYPGGGFSYTTCLEDGCYNMLFSMAADGVIDTVAYTISIGDSVITEGIVTQPTNNQISFGLNADCEEDIWGCTDPAAINYDPNATIEDGSCEYGPCEGNEVLVVMDTQMWGNEISWNIIQDGVVIASQQEFGSDATTTYPVCLEDGCYTFEMFDSFGDGWNGATFTIILDGVVLAEGTLEQGQYGTIDFGVNSEDCGETEIFGCTDPAANNYNPEATIDDGSCEYEFECGISFTVTPDSTGAQVIWITPSENIFNAVEVLCDFGDGNTSSDLFPIHTYAGDGPYMLCLTALFQEPGSNEFCEITYCAELTDEMINPPGMQTQGFSINVVDPSGTTGIGETDLISDLTVWPNPASSHVQLEFSLDNSENIAIELFDLTGKQIQTNSFAASNGSNLYQMDISDLTPGMYLVRLTGEHNQTTTRLVKQ